MNVRPGDLAVAVRGKYITGCFCTVLRPSSNQFAPMGMWEVRFFHPVLWTGGMGVQGFVDDAWLRPIRPREESASVATHQEKEVKA